MPRVNNASAGLVELWSMAVSLHFSRGIFHYRPNDYHQGSRVGNRLNTKEALDCFARSLIKTLFIAGNPVELTQVFQLIKGRQNCWTPCS